jgi:two-component sensor histidine kinase
VTGGGPIEAARPPAERRLLGGVRGRLLILVCAAMLPVIGMAGYQAWHDHAHDLAAGREAAQSLQQQAVAQHRAELALLEEALASLAGLAEEPQEACAATLRSARSLLPQRLAELWVLDGEGRLRCGALPASEGDEARARLPIPDAVAGLALGAIMRDAAQGSVLLRLALPVTAADGSLRAVIGATARLAPTLPPDAAAPDAPASRVWLIDRTGTALALAAATEADLPRDGIGPDGAAFEGRARSGEAFAWSVGTVRPGLRVMVGVKLGGMHGAARAALAQRLVEIALFVLACLGVVLLGVELGVARPLRRLAARVRGWSPREAYLSSHGRLAPSELRDLDAALLAASGAISEREAALRAALRQRDEAMDQINHRIQNNLQIVASLLGMQAENSRWPEVKAELSLTRHRVRALATLYRHLSRAAQPGRIRLRPFLEELCRQLGEPAGAVRTGKVTMTVEIEEIELAADLADSLTLLVTEAVGNALQHAFPDDAPGRIRVSLRQEGGHATLLVADDGVGLPEGSETGHSLGLSLIRGFAEHLGGAAVITGTGGTRVSVSFPLQPIEPAADG